MEIEQREKGRRI